MPKTLVIAPRAYKPLLRPNLVANSSYNVCLTVDLHIIDDLEPHLEQAIQDDLLTEDEAMKLLAQELVKSLRAVTK